MRQKALQHYIEPTVMYGCEAWTINEPDTVVVILKQNFRGAMDSDKDQHRINRRSGMNKIIEQQNTKTAGCLGWSHINVK